MSGGELSYAFVRELFETSLVEAGYRPGSIRWRMADLKPLFAYLAATGETDLRAVDREAMLGYLQYLGARRNRNTGKPIAPATRYGLASTANLLFRMLHERGLILANPMRGLRLCEPGFRSLRIQLTEADVARFLDNIDTDAPFGLRDRALYELIYSSGLRSGEASGLCVSDIDLERRIILVRDGKYAKDRYVPITEVAAERLAALIHARPADAPVFRGRNGRRVSGSTINDHFKTLLKREGLYREGLSVHSLRHACATHLLAHGADIRYVQGLLGHKSVQTTVRYTNELVENLRRRYLRGHPRENETRREVDASYREAFASFIGQLGEAKRKRDRRSGVQV